MTRPIAKIINGASSIPDQCSVDTYHRRASVESGLLSGMTTRAIERQERAVDPKAPGRNVIGRHRDICMPAAVRAAESKLQEPRLAIVQAVATAATERLDAVKPLVAFSDRIEALLIPIEKLITACDLWLAHPTDPTRYDLNPRTYEVDVTFDQPMGNLSIRKTEKLSKLMADVEAGLGITVVKGEAKTADVRKLILDAVACGRTNLELIAKILGLLKPETQAVTINQFLGSPDWQATQAVLVEAVREHPEAAEKVAAALEAVGKVER